MYHKALAWLASVIQAECGRPNGRYSRKYDVNENGQCKMKMYDSDCFCLCQSIYNQNNNVSLFIEIAQCMRHS